MNIEQIKIKIDHYNFMLKVTTTHIQAILDLLSLPYISEETKKELVEVYKKVVENFESKSNGYLK